jgi:carboxyl-terminal processing protease
MTMKNFKTIILPLLFSLVLITGILIGNWYSSNFYGESPSLKQVFSRNRFSKAHNNFVTTPLLPSGNKLNSLLTYIINEYVDSVNIDELTEAAIPSILDELDPHSVYIPAKELSKYNEPLVGNFSGIGVQFNMVDDTVAIINTIANGPSAIVGIFAGDRIVKVDGRNVAGVKLPSDSIVGMLRGPRGTTVRVVIFRRSDKNLLDFEITRDDIPLYSVDVAYMINETTGYIKISTFAQTTYDEFLDAAEKLHSKGMKRLILDLRSNGGGLMDAATKIADQFLDDGKLIVYTQGKARARYDVFSTPGGICRDDKVCLLMDEFSASASEILAGAIQDNDRGTIIGRRSFGKGLVQEQIQFRDGSALRLTIARYYTPTGRSIQKPYSRNKSDYYSDLNTRYAHGEFENADSIKFADSLKFVTPGGKTVYGGGGIMPDIFVPMDTSGISPYFNRVRNLGFIYRFAFDYSDKNRDKLHKYTTAKELSAYLDKTAYYKDFLKYAENKGVFSKPGDLAESGDLIKVQLKAYIARNILDNEGFFPIIQEIDNTLMKAVEVIDAD